MSQSSHSLLVTYEQFARFISEERYFRREFWHLDVSRLFWDLYVGRKDLGGDEVLRRIGFRWSARHLPVRGVSWFEADAYCRFAGGRLPWFSEVVADSRSAIPEWCGDWFHSKAHGPYVQPEPPLRRRVVNWSDESAVAELIDAPIGFRVMRKI